MQELDNLDLSVLDQLQDLKVGREALQARLRAMDERRSEVAAPVYLRVRADYEQQKQKLVDQEAPLKARAKELFNRLREALERLDREFEETKLSLQELEFRHSLGEFERGEFADRKGSIEQGLHERGQFHEQARSIRERFISVFGSEADLDPTESTVRRAPVSVPPPLVKMPAVEEPLPGMGHTTEQVRPVLPPPPVAAPPKRANPDATVVFRPGRLSPLNAEAGGNPTMLSLKPITLGSDSSCDIRVVGNGVQAKHASITLTRSGFMLKDLAGGGAVSVNGQIVDEQLLKDGDALQVGPAKYAFRLS